MISLCGYRNKLPFVQVNQANLQKSTHHKGFLVDSKERKDRVVISSFGKTQSLMESFLKQKEDILNRKNELIRNTLEQGGQLESIKPRLEIYDEQLKQLEEQFNQSMLQQAAVMDPKKPERKSQAEKPADQNFHALTDVSLTMDKVQLVSRVQRGLESKTRILSNEIVADNSRGGASSHKTELLASLKQRSSSLAKQLKETVSEISESMQHEFEDEIQDDEKAG